MRQGKATDRSDAPPPRCERGQAGPEPFFAHDGRVRYHPRARRLAWPELAEEVDDAALTGSLASSATDHDRPWDPVGAVRVDVGVRVLAEQAGRQAEAARRQAVALVHDVLHVAVEQVAIFDANELCGGRRWFKKRLDVRRNHEDIIVNDSVFLKRAVFYLFSEK